MSRRYVLEDSKMFTHTLGIQVVVTMLDLWMDGHLPLSSSELDQLEGFMHAFLTDIRDNSWRLAEGERKR